MNSTYRNLMLPVQCLSVSNKLETLGRVYDAYAYDVIFNLNSRVRILAHPEPEIYFDMMHGGRYSRVF